ncbi:hypothetical protein EVG20_g4460 [Dentipellis fragilis]|uniref:Uncharacterized protein n=1 Tax=Dentipellis fragilis TaxID=205917 RepID=A0A4Y9YWF5_9AGAM|nr:hypothetical protein EVG20_g4460 [Dentipellis fragilis]
MRRRQSMSTTTKMNAQPSAMSRISHHASGRVLVVFCAGAVRPVMEGSGGSGAVPEACGTATRSERQMPRPEMVFDVPLQLAWVQVPDLSVWLGEEHERQLDAPGPEQLAQELSHDWQDEDVVSKNWFFEHVGRQRPLVSTGRFGGQLAHWLKDVPEQVAQSGWQAMQEPEEVKVFEGQEVTHLPPEAS